MLLVPEYHLLLDICLLPKSGVPIPVQWNLLTDERICFVQLLTQFISLQWEQHFLHFSFSETSTPFLTMADTWQGNLQPRKITREQWTQGHVHRNSQVALTTDMTDCLSNVPFKKQSKETTSDYYHKAKGFEDMVREGNGEKEEKACEPEDMCLAVFQERYN